MGYFESFIGVNFWTAAATLLNFLILFFVARHFLIAPVLKIIADRQSEIADAYANAAQAETAARDLEQEYQQKLATASQTGQRILQEAVARGQAQEAEIIRSAHADAAAIMERATADVAQAKKKAVNEVKNEISVIAVSIAEKMLARAMKPEDQRELVDAFINGLGD